MWLPHPNFYHNLFLGSGVVAIPLGLVFTILGAEHKFKDANEEHMILGIVFTFLGMIGVMVGCWGMWKLTREAEERYNPVGHAQHDPPFAEQLTVL